MASKILAFALVLLTSAAALNAVSNASCNSTNFSLAMRIGGADGVYVSLYAIDSGTPGTLNVVGLDSSHTIGTPVIRKGPSGSASLTFDIDEGSDCETTQTGQFGIFVADLGERYSAQAPIVAVLGHEWPHFYVARGTIMPEATAASQLWYACNTTILGNEYTALSWGVYNSNGSSPYGCEPTWVVENCSVPHALE